MNLCSLPGRCENQINLPGFAAYGREKALSENIEVISIVGEYLEHFRIYYFIMPATRKSTSQRRCDGPQL